jgi:hypothetical protein
MRRLLVTAALVLTTCGSDNGVDQCMKMPPPPACMQTCNPNASNNTCPAGFYCTIAGHCGADCTQGGSECAQGDHCSANGKCVGGNNCTGQSCQLVNCTSMGKPDTSVSGTVFAPNGTLPLYGIIVYAPNVDPGPLPSGAVCSRCADALPGGLIVKTQTDEAGNFKLSGIPAGANVRVVITSGKWRRQLMLPMVQQCADNPLPAAMTSLPKNKSEGDMPQIAISTGSADALECLVRKLGIDEAEITTSAQGGRIHLYTDSGAGMGEGTNSFQSGGNFTDSAMLWGDTNKMKQYDIMILSCEGAQHPETKPQGAMDALKAYADFGGRVFLSHWHNVWIEGSTQGGGNQAPAVWPAIATWNNSMTTFSSPPDTIDEANNPKGQSFATWMVNVMGSPMRDQIPIMMGKQTATAVDNAKAERWVYWDNGGTQYPQNFQFTTPNEQPPDNRCGKVVFSDMHVASGSMSAPGTPYPMGCSTAPLTPQEKALAFMFFDISSCVNRVP